MPDRLDVMTAAVEAIDWPELDPLRVSTPDGPVDFTSITVGVDCVEVEVAGPSGGDPRFRVYNPPTMTTDGRADPVAALAEAVARFGGCAR